MTDLRDIYHLVATQPKSPFFFLHCSSNMFCAVLCLIALSCLMLWDPTDYSLPGFSVHGDCVGKSTGVGCHALLQGFSQPRHRTKVSCLAGRLFTNWATREAQEYFSRASSRPGNLTGVSCIAGGFFTSWATIEAQQSLLLFSKSFSRQPW